MVNIIEKKLDIENEALKRFEMIGKFISCKPKIITGSIRSIDKTNISYIEPHRIIYNETTFLFFNFTNEVYIEDLNVSGNFKEITNDLHKRNLISSKERKVIFNPPKLFTKSEINKALKSINKEMDEFAEKYYHINQNENDYSI